ncbi:hypothetical protein P175DRAFT_0450944 [Aspergillus ochraceoroseus IBT 24754]|uniref:Urease accessory protein UreD n=1 Tax=Aspergillus ochraceoroseus IBT 24754 TaxID=1392256 RepID=A0A2T5M8M9_9EURO|nr:uncharacterized protein P175DRAFT_0450944 [Aspergillus ochraceoroseus IBT 24754]PTU24887.1 hypothetical protein P175DRAFT_0450944 [Aspergillus ochraceoroseus IBT 24754]
MPIKSPFESSIAKPGQGKVVLSLLPPANPTLTTLTYKYPLKLLARTPRFTPQSPSSQPVHLYLLTYGGGLLPGDHIEVSITLEPRTRLVVTTPQGSTKIFKTDADTLAPTAASPPAAKSRQSVDVRIGKEAALCYLPDPAVPYKGSRYEQTQRFTVESSAKDPTRRSSLCLLDWVTQGRTARGEAWDFQTWKGKNEIWCLDEKKPGTGLDQRGPPPLLLLLRDSLILDAENHQNNPWDPAATLPPNPQAKPPAPPPAAASRNLIRERTSPHGVIGTLILYGPVFESLAAFIVDRFSALPRIGARNWASSAAPVAVEAAPPNFDAQVTFTAARVRAGCVLVKFGAADFETAKDWLGGILRAEGTVVREFGEEALFCL